MSEFLSEFPAPVESNLPPLFLYRGLTDTQIKQLIAYTQNDELVKKFDADDKRFGNPKLYNEWITTKDRTIYALAEADGTLHGIYWMGPKELPKDRKYIENISPTDYPYTMGTRLYESARGHHLSTRFVLQATADFVRMRNLNHTGFWAEVSADNERSVRKNLAAEYRIVTTPNEYGKIIMVQDYPLSNSL